MNRRAYLSSLAFTAGAVTGCIGRQSDSSEQPSTTTGSVSPTTSAQQDTSTNTTTDNSNGPTVDTNRAVFPYNSTAYRDIFDYESSRSRDTLVTSPSRSGSALKVPIPKGKHRGMRMRFWMADQFESEPTSASATFWLYVPSEFQFANSHSGGGKLPGFQGTYGRCGNGSLGPCDGTDGWSARMSFIRPKAAYLDTDFGLAYYVYHGEMSGEAIYPYGTYLRWNQGLNFDQWYKIDQYVEMNTPGTPDGTLKAWVDGDLALDRDGMLFRRSGYESIRIQEFVNTVYFGGEWDSPQDNAFYFDDLEIRVGKPDPSKL